MCHHVWGGWHALQIGPWVNYMPLSGLGGLVLVEAISARQLRWLALASGAF